MTLPKEIRLTALFFGDGANGYRQQTFQNTEFGITVSKIKENRDSGWKEVWTIKSSPEKEFDSYRELCAAVNKSNVTIKVRK
jgi:hypothetical protein